MKTGVKIYVSLEQFNDYLKFEPFEGYLNLSTTEIIEIIVPPEAFSNVQETTHGIKVNLFPRDQW